MRLRVITASGAALLLAACAHAPSPCACGEDSPFLSKSKLSLYVAEDYTPGAQEVVEAAPRVLQALDPQRNPSQRIAMSEYKRLHPPGGLVVRITENATGIRYALAGNPKASADDWFARVLAPALAKLAPGERALIGFLEGPSGCDGIPGWETLESAAWRGRFDARIAKRIAQMGLRPCIGPITTAIPPGPLEEMEAKLDAYAPALYAAKHCYGAWGYPAYSTDLSMDPAKARETSLRYRMAYDYFSRTHPRLADMPLLVHAAWTGSGGNGAPEPYEAWLDWFDQEIRKDPFVIAAVLGQNVGAVEEPSFEMEPITGWLARHLSGAR